jgi:hypothetical protein
LIQVKPLPARTTANLPEKSSLDKLLEARNKPVVRPTMGTLPSEMAKSKLKMDIFQDFEEDDDDD